MRVISAGFWFLLVLFAACSSTGSVADNSKSTSNSIYPEWYSSSRSLTSSPSAYNGFGSAIAADSLDALSKAAEHAQNNLETGISEKLESIRSEAVVELGSDSGLDSPRFIVVLRKAEAEVSDVSETSNLKVEQNETSGYRAFVKVQAGKSELIEELDRRFSGYAKAWNAMKSSEAFSDF